MTTFTVMFDTDNSAFEGTNLRSEISRVLRVIINQIQTGENIQPWRTISDINGNVIGRWGVSSMTIGKTKL